MSDDPVIDRRLEYLSGEIEAKIVKIKEKVKKNKDRTGWLNAMSLSLSALITLSLGVELSVDDIFQKNIALVLGALLTVVTGWNALFDYKKLWFRQKKTLLGLYQIRNELEYLKSSNEISNSLIDDIHARYMKLWSNDASEWISINSELSDSK